MLHKLLTWLVKGLCAFISIVNCGWMVIVRHGSDSCIYRVLWAGATLRSACILAPWEQGMQIKCIVEHPWYEEAGAAPIRTLL